MSETKNEFDQEFLLATLLPVLNTRGHTFRKFQPIKARLALEGEQIVSVTSDGQETVNTAKSGDFVVENRTTATEQYLVPQSKFKNRYQFIRKLDSTWTEYYPAGRIQAIAVDKALLELLGAEQTFFIRANWGSLQRVLENDFLASPLPDLNEIYRIARAEFAQTYKRE